MAAPFLEYRASTTPFAVLSSLQLVGTGAGSAIIAGQTSLVSTLRVYNNFAAGGGVGDALNCVLAAYDSITAQGQATGVATAGAWLQVQVQDYNGVTTGQDTQFFAIGGTQKHAVPTNSGTIAGATTNYITLNVKAVVPVGAPTGTQPLALWLEYSYV